MRCAACGHENRDTANFCLACGQRLVLTCGQCAAELPPAARFCDACGHPVAAPAVAPPVPGSPETISAPAPAPSSYTPKGLAAKILTGRRALKGERKQVTVLFGDIMNSTPLAERLDPEEMHGIMDRCYRLLLAQVHRYEGTVNQFTGDGIMALFGAPIAHEDAPERAVLAALGMQASMQDLAEELERERGIEFRLRIGINTGPVVVGEIGDDLRMDYTAIGDTTHLAARLQTAAPPGGVLISDHTAKLVSGRFVTRSVGPLQLKGKSKPVHAHEVSRALPRAPLVASSEHGLTPLVGRAAELATLDAIFDRVRGGQGQVVFVVGEAGIGKSRLIHEFQRRLGTDDVTWLQGRCISFGRGIPLLPVIDVVKSGFGVDEGDDEPTVIHKIEEGLLALGPEHSGMAPQLRGLLAVDAGDAAIGGMDSSARHFATFEALKRLLLAVAARRQLVVLIEDLHWIDAASDEFLTYAVDAVAGARILLLCTHRPGYRSVLGDRSYFNRLTLQALSAEDTAAMASTMIEAHGLPSEIRTLIISKAEGNPFFIEEVTKSLVETGAVRRGPDGAVLARPVSEIVIPNTIQDVIMARIDRLGDEPKQAIQIASVIGREFAVRLLQRASELGEGVNVFVGELRALELIYEKFGVPELAYMFKHALTHDVAYESILLQRRKQLHRAIGTVIEELYADRLAEHWETLAHHFYRAEDWPSAFAYLVKAGDKAGAAFANSEAVHFYDLALAVAEHLTVDPGQRAAIFEGRARALQGISAFPPAIESYQQALALVSDAGERARLHAAMAEALWYAHEFDASIAAADEALAVAKSRGDQTVAGQACFAKGVVATVRGQLQDSVRHYADAAGCFAATGQRVWSARTEAWATIAANWRGEYGEALKRFKPVLALLKDANELPFLSEVSSHFGIALGGAGEYRRALEFLDEAIGLTESIGDKFWRARIWNTRGWLLGELGAYEAAREANQRCLEIAAQMGALRMTPELIGNAEANLADATLARSDLAATEPHLEAVAALLADPRNEWMTWRYGMHFNASAAELALARGDPGRAQQHIERCVATAQRTHSRRYLVRAGRLRALAHTTAGDLVEAERLAADTVGQASALANPAQLWQTLLLHSRILNRLGRRDDATARAREGLELVASIARTLPPELAATLQASPTAQELGELGA